MPNKGSCLYSSLSTVSGEPSCADGWELQKTSCYMYSAPKVTKSWRAAKAYCEGSKAQLVNPKNSEDIPFLSNLSKNRSESTFWTELQRGSYGGLHRRSGREAPRCSAFNKLKRQLSFKDCSRALPFICERGRKFIVSYCYSFVYCDLPGNNIVVRN